MQERQRIERTAAPLRQQVVKLLREDILSGDLVPGQRLVESMLCESYGVSRTVIREALRQLESEHLIQVIPAQGPIVTVLSEKEIKGIYVVRAALEGLAGELFARDAGVEDVALMRVMLDRLGPEYRDGTVQEREAYKAEFYRLLLHGAGNEVLTEALHAIHARTAVFRRYAFLDEGRVRFSIEELTRIIQATAIARDPEAARRACADHITRAAELAVLEYERRGTDFVRSSPRSRSPQ